MNPAPKPPVMTARAPSAQVALYGLLLSAIAAASGWGAVSGSKAADSAATNATAVAANATEMATMKTELKNVVERLTSIDAKLAVASDTEAQRARIREEARTIARDEARTLFREERTALVDTISKLIDASVNRTVR